jgi:hypothetical protein
MRLLTKVLPDAMRLYPLIFSVMPNSYRIGRLRTSRPISATVKKRTSKELKLIILTAGLLVTFAWMGFLAWAASRIVSGW